MSYFLSILEKSNRLNNQLFHSLFAFLAITADPFIVFSSNILAVMGLRSMFFLIVGMLDKFKYISYSLVVILAFVGIKMIISHHVEISEWLSLGVIAISLAEAQFLWILLNMKSINKN